MDAMDKSEKLNLLELLVRAKPFAALDDDAFWFRDLVNEKNDTRFIEILLGHLSYHKSSFQTPTIKHKKFRKTQSKRDLEIVNSRIKMQQQLLEEPNKNRKFELLESYLNFEIKNAVARF